MPRMPHLLCPPHLPFLILCATAVFAQTKQYGARLDGKPLAQLAPAGTKAVVLFFIASDCPISNRTFPEMKRLREAFSTQGVRFWFVYPNATETPAGIRAHQIAFDPADAESAITDPEAALTHLARAGVTPEAAVLAPDGSRWKAVYTGRIDDRFVRIGLERPAPTQLLAGRALAELLAGKPVTPDAGKPVGCAIYSARTARP